ncbi:MAG TPA: nuclear transport factor 2 family protein [Candidatus Bathyarchaeia archaeon]|nr:nuclear transport factor 2 family protein [Candidatus Bathyarchaeia archaeon]
MDVTRRQVMAAGAAALGAVGAGLLCSASVGAQSGDEVAVADAVEILRKGTLEADKAKLSQVTAEQLSYGHSSNRVETKEQFINGVLTRKAVVKSLAFPELKIAVVGNNAIARHIYLSDSEQDGKATTTRIGVLQVWQKQDGGWKLLARQGFTLPA